MQIAASGTRPSGFALVHKPCRSLSHTASAGLLPNTGLADLCPLLWEQTSLKTRFPSIPEWFAAGPVEEIRSRVLQSKRRTSCRRKPGLFAQLLQVPPCFAQCPYRSSIRQHQASRCLLIRQKPTMATIDASLDELTGAIIIITATIISTTDRWRDGSRPISFTASAKNLDFRQAYLRTNETRGKRLAGPRADDNHHSLHE